ncbi:MAG TPA: C13 family peptidase, partial [Steroidobacteraceae bacterium]|nr:C13 family peptidase [Steroidobacteraceae bacterium]
EASPARPPSVAQEVLALLRLQTWGLVDGARLFGRDVTLILLGVFSLVLWIGLDRLRYGGEVELFIYGVTENAAMVLAVLAVAWLMSRASRPRIELRQGLLLVLGFLPIFIVMFWIAEWLPQLAIFAIAILVTGWAERFFGAGLRSLTGKRQWMAVTSSLIGVVTLVYLSSQVYYTPGFWIEREPDAEKAAQTRRKNEQIVFEQSARINADIASLAPREAGQPNVFFLGFAGYGGQKVFAEEIGLAAKRVGERYGSAQRSVLLVNDHRDALKYPLASAPSLRHALNALSQQMNLDEDVLFLALSSHGSEGGTVSVSSELGYWRDLGATDLADMLRESGIRWRVIVVSACYAGTFVEPLRDDNTIILTAAAADRTSFGCSDDNDLTYFGEAFYRDALPKAANLRAAFDTARAAILERESGEGMTPSNPQAHFGAAIEQKLAAMEATRTN